MTFLIWATVCTSTEKKYIYAKLISIPKPIEDNLKLDYCSWLLFSQTLMSCTLHDDSMVVSLIFLWSFVCCLNISFVLVPVVKPNTCPAVCADLFKPYMARDIPACFWRFDVFSELRNSAAQCH